jgi:hypothetical protein
MKSIRFVLTAVLSAWLFSTVHAQTISPTDSTGLPGDHFSLEGALDLFKKSNSPGDFEKALNSEDSKVNNLDLNGDGDIDYIKVIDKKEGDAHALILQAAVSENENQDIAVIELEQKDNDQATVQIVGDEDVYGENRIVEPVVNTPVQSNTSTPAIVNVWAWPAVRYVYAPSYVAWVSPWGWRARPMWWRPWRPVRWHAFYPYHSIYRRNYTIVYHRRALYAHRVYAPVRTTSVIVHTRHAVPIQHYRATRTTKTVTVSSNNRQLTTTRKTTTVRSNKGRVKATKTTSKKVRKN